MHKEPLPILSNNKYKYTEEKPNKLYTNTRDQSMKNPEKETRYERIGANVFPLRNAGDNGGVNVWINKRERECARVCVWTVK